MPCDFYLFPNGKTTGFYLGAEGTCESVDAIVRAAERKRHETEALRNLPEAVDE